MAAEAVVAAGAEVLDSRAAESGFQAVVVEGAGTRAVVAATQAEVVVIREDKTAAMHPRLAR